MCRYLLSGAFWYDFALKGLAILVRTEQKTKFHETNGLSHLLLSLLFSVQGQELLGIIFWQGYLVKLLQSNPISLTLVRYSKRSEWLIDNSGYQDKVMRSMIRISCMWRDSSGVKAWVRGEEKVKSPRLRPRMVRHASWCMLGQVAGSRHRLCLYSYRISISIYASDYYIS